MSGFRQLNEVSLARLRLVQEYVTLMVEMEQRLLQARIGAARARTLVGHNYASLTAVDDVEEMRAVVRVEVSPSNVFGLVKEDEEEEGKEKKKEEGVRKRKGKGKEEKGDSKKEETEEKDGSEDEEEKPKKKSVAPPSFRPFGILEPSCAKEARKEAAKAAELAIAAATVRAKIIDCDRQTKQLLASLEKPELETIFKLLAV